VKHAWEYGRRLMSSGKHIRACTSTIAERTVSADDQ